MNFRAWLIGQFSCPSGMLGHVAGWIMSCRPSNRDRNRWTLDLLEIAPRQRILELGCGPGFALSVLLKRNDEVDVVAIDHSEVMVAQARTHNRAAIRAGRLTVRRSSIEPWTGVEGSFDRIYSANVLQFVRSRPVLLGHLYRTLHPGGRLATTYQPRGADACDADAISFGESLLVEMREAGFVDCRVEFGPKSPVLTVCVIGERAAAMSDSDRNR